MRKKFIIFKVLPCFGLTCLVFLFYFTYHPVVYSPEKANHTRIYSNLDLTTLNFERYASNCKASSNASMIFVGLMSRVDSFERRLTIRNTLLKQMNASEQKLLFFVAKSKNESINVQVDEEEIEFNDLVRLEFVEDYYNLTLKTISFLEYFNRYCNEFKYAIKLDDDVFINWDGMKSYLDQEKNDTNPAIYCVVYKNARVNRNLAKKWYVEESQYANSTYPTYCSGAGYVLNREAVQQVMQQHQTQKDKIFYLEDVYATGMLTYKTKIRMKNMAKLIKIYNHLYFKNHYNKKIILLMHPVNDIVYNNMYKSVTNTLNS